MATVLKRRPDTNISETERWISLIGGAGLAAWGLTRRDKPGFGIAAIGGAMMYWGATGHCDLYQTLGLNTAKRGYGKGTGSKAGVPYELGIRVDEEVRINRPVEHVYRFWRNLENLPRFMRHLHRIEVRDDQTSHWIVCGPAGMQVEWDAEIVNDVENQVIGWRSLPGSQVDNGGSVRFDPMPDGSTAVRVSLQYNPPAGTLGAWLARRFGEDPEHTIREDLQRFRELMDTGTISIACTGKAPKKRKQRGDRCENDDVQNASEESFPASDAPSWTPEALGNLR
jgi:uncharacterized membrane protein